MTLQPLRISQPPPPLPQLKSPGSAPGILACCFYRSSLENKDMFPKLFVLSKPAEH